MTTGPDNRSHAPFDSESLFAPWGDRPSIYAHIERNLDPSSGRLRVPFLDLPDEPPVAADGFRFAAGALDGIMGHGLADTGEQDAARVVYTQLMHTVKHRDRSAFNTLHGLLLEHPALSYLDQLNRLLADSSPDAGRDVAVIGRYLLKNAADREVVKFAINLVGVCGGAQDHVALLTIGAHDEFTLFAIVALGHAGGGQKSVWEMAKRVDGWGRIQCIERLDTEALDHDIRYWLLTEGYMNFVATEYTAAICARRGGLKEALESHVMDRRVIDGAAEILSSLARGRPGEGMAGYAGSASATERFLAIVERDESPSILWLLAAVEIEKYVRCACKKPAGAEWTREDLDRCSSGLDRVRARAEWPQLVSEGLESSDDYRFGKAAEAAQFVGIDAWEHRFVRLIAGHEQWYWLLQTTDSQRLDRVLEFARKEIDLKAIASGYGNASWSDPAFAKHRKLDSILHALKRWPGRGLEFIVAGFRSPVVSNRWGATRAALRWAPEHRQPLLEAVRQLHGEEQNIELQASLARILAGEFDATTSSD